MPDINNPILHPLDLFGVPPANWWARQVCRILGCRTFHWGAIVKRDKDGYITSETLGTGTDIARLDYPKVHCYRIWWLRPIDPMDILSVHSEYGALPYNMEANFRTAIWWLMRHFLHKAIPVIREPPFNCVGWVVCLVYEFGVKVIQDNEYATPANLEKSPCLEYLGEWNG